MILHKPVFPNPPQLHSLLEVLQSVDLSSLKWLESSFDHELWDYFQVGNKLVKEMDHMEGYQIALTTWAKWVESDIDFSKTKVFFGGVAAVHLVFALATLLFSIYAGQGTRSYNNGDDNSDVVDLASDVLHFGLLSSHLKRGNLVLVLGVKQSQGGYGPCAATV
ncbi:hypothetical protein L3X38_023043 [Prunus dulcis]|uniref:Trichome birefringence-like C-terminal domain-containing protein n=1 Tax=Prunus dulcis TaxID=3755 RepID=A0AAD4VYR9_PRUDU|nr:hypothetical protein L3X38_023043 [Prunus dulcis]